MAKKLQFELLQDWRTPDLCIKKGAIITQEKPGYESVSYYDPSTRRYRNIGRYEDVRKMPDWFREVKPEAASAYHIDLFNDNGKFFLMNDWDKLECPIYVLHIKGWKRHGSHLLTVINKALEAYAEENS